jgi:hypothetical protein
MASDPAPESEIREVERKVEDDTILTRTEATEAIQLLTDIVEQHTRTLDGMADILERLTLRIRRLEDRADRLQIHEGTQDAHIDDLQTAHSQTYLRLNALENLACLDHLYRAPDPVTGLRSKLDDGDPRDA